MFMGISKGNLCGCGVDAYFIAFAGKAGVCDVPCAGDDDQTCGGDVTYEHFRLVDNDIGLNDDDFEGKSGRSFAVYPS